MGKQIYITESQLDDLSNLKGYVNSGLMMVGEEKHVDDFDYNEFMEEIGRFMKDGGLDVFPLPELELNNEKQDGLFIKTGHYEPENKKIVIFTNDRHIKDCARSLAHELVHHAQNLRGDDLNFTSDDDVKDNKKLEKLESEAYLKGNIFFRKWTEYARKKNDKKLNESIEEINANDIDLSSFDIKKNLNKKFWKDGHLDSRIRMKLLAIAEDFIDYLGIDWVEPDDIVITGSLANYNWNKKYSDVDLHVIMPYSKIDKNVSLVDDFLYSKKELWNRDIDGLKIFGFSVECFVEDSSGDKDSESGIYSIKNDEWVVKPKREHLSDYDVDKPLIRKRLAKYINLIDELEFLYNETNGNTKKEKLVYKKACKLWDKIKSERKNGFDESSNEMNTGNLVFKALRRRNCLEKVTNIKTDLYNKIKSLNETEKK